MNDSVFFFNVSLPISRDLYCQLFLQSEEAGVDFDWFVAVFFGVRKLGLIN